MKYLRDTDHVSILQTGTGREFQAVVNRLTTHAPEVVGVSIVTFHEQVMGCNVFISRAPDAAGIVRGYAMLTRLLESFVNATVVPYDTTAAEEFQKLRKAGVRIGTMDLRIAAIAICRGLTLVTRNTRDFLHIPSLQLEDWTQ